MGRPRHNRATRKTFKRLSQTGRLDVVTNGVAVFPETRDGVVVLHRPRSNDKVVVGEPGSVLKHDHLPHRLDPVSPLLDERGMVAGCERSQRA